MTTTTGNPQPDWRPEAEWAVEEQWRESERKLIDWKLRGEERLRNFTPEEKAETMRDLSDTALAAIFNQLILQAGFDPHYGHGAGMAQLIKDEVTISNAMNMMRLEQADLAEQIFMETGKDS